MDFTIATNKGTWGLVHINGKMISIYSLYHIEIINGFVAQSVGAHLHVDYIFLNSNEEIVVRTPKSNIFFYYIQCVVLFVVCDFTIYTYFTLVKVAKLHPVSLWLPRREDCSPESALMRDIALFDGTVSGSGTGHLDYGATGPVPDTEPRL